MYLSSYYLPTLKHISDSDTLISYEYSIRAGLVRQLTAGIYSWLPLGLRVLNKIQRIIHVEMERIGAIEMLMSCIQPADLWQRSGRYDSYGKEMLRIKDRHDRDMLFGPTNEEVIASVFCATISSYKELPKNLYHIQWKFRDEIRPRFGVMRGREFLMKDGYSFDLDYQNALVSYNKVYGAYLRIFRAIGLSTMPVRAQTGPIGGDLSHEFAIAAAGGESKIYYDGAIDEFLSSGDADMENDIEKLQSFYAVADDMHDPASCPVPPERLRTMNAIEVGHVFYFGTKYSEPMQVKVTDNSGQQRLVHMGSYGIGVSRLVGAIIEASHDDRGIIWPESVAPFKVGILNLKVGDKLCDQAAQKIYQHLQTAGVEILYDDTDESIGSKFARMDLIGLSWQIIIGKDLINHSTISLKRRKDGYIYNLSLDSATEQILNIWQDPKN
jgi:prolyl-tRNA synthetase